jgi:hypothetical protein
MLQFKNVGNKSSVGSSQPIGTERWKAAKQKLAKYLQNKSEQLNLRVKKYYLYAFCVLFGGFSSLIIIRSVNTTIQNTHAVTIMHRMHQPEGNTTNLRLDSAITKREYERVIRFKNYMIELRDDSGRRKRYDSIIAMRPQLMDSIEQFEKIYLSQK